jgi:hypothetical protein
MGFGGDMAEKIATASIRFIEESGERSAVIPEKKFAELLRRLTDWRSRNFSSNFPLSKSRANDIIYGISMDGFCNARH